MTSRLKSWSAMITGFTAISVVAILLMTFLAPRLEPLGRNTTVGVALTVHAVGSGAIALLPADAPPTEQGGSWDL
ncbi:MAG: hypothetical protein ACRDJV_11445 [Actinomycetota bacterium]